MISDDPTEFLPLFPEEDEDTIRTRWEAWANEGLTPNDTESWVDVRAGNFFALVTAPGIREFAKLYDLLGTEYASAPFVLWSWGEYLDDLAAGIQLTRAAATFASGEVTFSGTNGTVITAGTRVASEGTPDTPGPEYETQADVTVTLGVATVAVVAVEAGAAGNVAAGAVNLLITPISGITAVTNDEAMSAGADVEGDDELRDRMLAAYANPGAGNASDYEVWALGYIGVGFAFVLPLWDGPGTVKVVILGDDRAPVDASVVTGLQNYLDPVPGQGAGRAPIGATVTVTTPTEVPVDADATLVLDDGYSLDGAAGTIDLTDEIEGAITDAILAGRPDSEIVYQAALGGVMEITGVHDVTALTLNGGTANIPLTDDQIGAVGTITLA